jgi:transaldolase
VTRDGVRGVTSNPTILEKAIAAGDGYDDRLVGAAADDLSVEDTYWELVLADIVEAADLLAPVHERTGGADGFVSLEVSPDLAADTAATQRAARDLFARIGRPNVMIKIPATLAGVPAIEESIAAGINVNVTLIFSLERHAQVGRRRSFAGGVGGVVLREPRRHRDRPAPPRGPPAPRPRRGRQRQAGLPAVPGELRG